jgi:hypothetical protein
MNPIHINTMALCCGILFEMNSILNEEKSEVLFGDIINMNLISRTILIVFQKFIKMHLIEAVELLQRHRSCSGILTVKYYLN